MHARVVAKAERPGLFFLRSRSAPGEGGEGVPRWLFFSISAAALLICMLASRWGERARHFFSALTPEFSRVGMVFSATLYPRWRPFRYACQWREGGGRFFLRYRLCSGHDLRRG